MSPATQLQGAMNLNLGRRYDDAIQEAAATLVWLPASGPPTSSSAARTRRKVCPTVQSGAGARSRPDGVRPYVITSHAYVLARAGRRTRRVDA